MVESDPEVSTKSDKPVADENNIFNTWLLNLLERYDSSIAVMSDIKLLSKVLTQLERFSALESLLDLSNTLHKLFL